MPRGRCRGCDCALRSINAARAGTATILGTSMRSWTFAFAQDAWLALARTQAALLRSTVAHNEQAFERLVHTTSGGLPAPAARASVDLPALPVGTLPWPALAKSFTESARAWWEAVAASNTAAWRDAAEPASVKEASPPAAAARGRRRPR